MSFVCGGRRLKAMESSSIHAFFVADDRTPNVLDLKSGVNSMSSWPLHEQLTYLREIGTKIDGLVKGSQEETTDYRAFIRGRVQKFTCHEQVVRCNSLGLDTECWIHLKGTRLCQVELSFLLFRNMSQLEQISNSIDYNIDMLQNYRTYCKQY
ncbi:hypothetical protein MUK42_15171 [Musa troglodytarum]|uniref:Uncharacterized protein n=1 Tax=Musa troglodytarum TaxID=320322 RepID=A0A9E7L7S5_9LILI|nr:hypothetical protein MUK42_15171 [Musa troglodytarum]